MTSRWVECSKTTVGKITATGSTRPQEITALKALPERKPGTRMPPKAGP